MTALRPWSEWTDEIAAGVRSVSDERLLAVACIIAKSTVVVCVGNGGSSAIAAHAAQAIGKPDYAAGGGHAAVCLTDNVPTLTAHANDGGWESALEAAGRIWLEMIPRSCLLAISSSGRSKNVIRLAQLARLLRRDVIAFTGFEGEPLRSIATISIHVESKDYEVIEPAHDALLHRVQAHVRVLSAAGGR